MRHLFLKAKDTPWGLVLFWLTFSGVLVYEAFVVMLSYIEHGTFEALIVPHMDALVLVVLMAIVLWELRVRHKHLDMSKRSLQAMMDNIPFIIWMKDKDGMFVSVNEGFLKATGFHEAREVLGKTDFDCWPEDMARHYREDDLEVMRSGKKKELEEEVVTGNKRQWVHTFKTPIMDADGIVIGTVGFARDITEKKEEEYKLQRFIDLQKDIVILTDGKVLDFANRALLEFFGYDSLGAFKKDYLCICERFIEHDNFFHLGKVRPEDENWIETLQALNPEERIVSMLDSETEPHAFAVSINRFDEADLYVVSFTDISSTVLETLSLKKRVIHDKLTGAFNREYFETYHRLRLEKFASEGEKGAVIFFDIDHFKQVNDTYGHNVGDDVLRDLVAIVRNSSRQGDVTVRWGGEEFLLLAPVDDLEGARAVAEHIRAQVEAYGFPTVGRVTCSFGVTLYRDGEPIVETVKRADGALYEAKDGGRNRVVAV